MILHYLKTGVRSVYRYSLFSLINIFGLALGLTCSLLIALWVADEFKMDNFHEEQESLFIVTSLEFSGDERNGSYDTPGLLGEELKRNIPEIQYSTGFAWREKALFGFGDKRFDFQGNFAGEDFFKMFTSGNCRGKRKCPQISTGYCDLAQDGVGYLWIAGSSHWQRIAL